MNAFVAGKGRDLLLVGCSVLAAMAFVAYSANAATTISSNIETGGTLSVTGASTLTGAASLGSTLGVTGATTLSSTLDVTGATTLSSTLSVTGDSTLSSTTATAFKIGQTGTRATGAVFGYCTIANVSVLASSTGMVSCSGATGIASGDRIFVQATSSIPNNFVIQAASSTASNVIQIDLLNVPTTTADSGPDDTGVHSFNFWAIR